MGIDRRLFAACLEAFVDCSVSGDSWRTPLDLAQECLDARGVLLMGYETFGQARLTAMETSAGIVPEMLDSYSRHFVPLDIRAEAGVRTPSGTVLHDEMLGDAREYERTPIYADLFLKYDAGRFLGLKLSPDSDEHEESSSKGTFLTILRRNAALEPSDEERGCFLMLGRVVQASLRAAAAFADVKGQSAAKSHAWEHARQAVFFLRSDGTVLEHNRSAADLLKKADGLSITQGRLHIDDSAARAMLERALVSAIINGGAPVQTSARRSTGRDPYGLLILPLRQERLVSGFLATARPAAIVFAIDPSSELQSPGQMWRLLFNLTRAECDIAGLLALGLSHRDIAERRAVSFETVRTQIKRVYEKLGVANQSEAVAKLLRLDPLRLPETD